MNTYTPRPTTDRSRKIQQIILAAIVKGSK